MHPEDQKLSRRWAIAYVLGVGAAISGNFFDLVNLDTGRAHNIMMPAIGLDLGAGAPGGSDPTYVEFQTSRPANFDDFDLAWAELTSAGVGVVVGGSGFILFINDKKKSKVPVVLATPFDRLARVILPVSFGWGTGAKASIGAQGMFKINYGVGKPMGTLEGIGLRLPSPDDFSNPPRLPKFLYKPKEGTIILPGDVLFAFNRWDLQPTAKKQLEDTLVFLLRRPPVQFSIEGHTDNVGIEAYNMDLSLKRASAVKDWLIRNQLPNPGRIRIQGWGESKPLEHNALPNGADNPAGRAKNRRVEIVF